MLVFVGERARSTGKSAGSSILYFVKPAADHGPCCRQSGGVAGTPEDKARASKSPAVEPKPRNRDGR
jgi:hypothetical protein